MNETCEALMTFQPWRWIDRIELPYTVLDKIGGSNLSETNEVNNKEIWGFNQ